MTGKRPRSVAHVFVLAMLLLILAVALNRPANAEGCAYPPSVVAAIVTRFMADLCERKQPFKLHGKMYQCTRVKET